MIMCLLVDASATAIYFIDLKKSETEANGIYQLFIWMCVCIAARLIMKFVGLILFCLELRKTD